MALQKKYFLVCNCIVGNSTNKDTTLGYVSRVKKPRHSSWDPNLIYFRNVLHCVVNFDDIKQFLGN